MLVVLILGLVAVAQTGDPRRGLEPDEPGEDEDLNRELWESVKKTPYSEALRYVAQAQASARATSGAEVVLPSGWKISPAGTQVSVGRLPYEVVPFAGQLVVLNTGYYARDQQQEVSVVDPATARVTRTLKFHTLFPSAQVGGDGDLYLSGGFDEKVYRVNSRFETVREYSVNGYAAGLAAIDASHLAVAYMTASDTPEDFQKGKYGQGKLAILNTATGGIDREIVAGYYPHTVRFVGDKLYVTVLGENKLLIYDSRLNLRKTLETGRTPEDICSDGRRVYVVNSSADSVSVVDRATETVVSTIQTPRFQSTYGSAPSSCAAAGGRLYVTQAHMNSVAVFDTARNRPAGLIPTGWFPTKVILHDDRLVVLSAKGISARHPNPNGPQPVADRSGPDYVLTLLTGSLALIPRTAIAAHVREWTRMVENGTPVYSPARGFKLPIRYVFYIIRENRTYDQVLGDLDHGNRDPSLTLFGRDVTPAAHALADQFVTLDNYYANGEVSSVGHSITTSGYTGPFLEWLTNAQYASRYTGYPFGIVPATTSPVYLWDALDQKGVDYRVYGENYFIFTRAYRILVETYGKDSEIARKYYAQMMKLAAASDRGRQIYDFAKPYYGQANTPADAERLLEKPEFASLLSEYLCGDASLADAIHRDAALRRRFAEYIYHYPFNFRSWDLLYSDLDRAEAWSADFEGQLRRGNVARLSYIWLPNDHTGGSDKRYLPPDQLVAQNDAALGYIVNRIARSPIWNQSLILVTEDDAQNGPDHVDATRTVALAAGPYVRRHALVTDRYDQLSLLRTIEMLLGLAPMNMNDSLAVPMFNIFTETPDAGGFAPPPISSHVNETDRTIYERLGKE